MIRVLYIITVFHCAISRLMAGEYYIAPNGTLHGDGSIERPFGSVEAALKKVGGSNTFIFKPGYYTGQITIFPKYSGTPQRPTILRSQYKYKAVINGSEGTVLRTYLSDWVIIDGFDISGGIGGGIVLDSNNCVIRNCFIHNNSGQGIGVFGRKNIVIENNLIEYNGQNPQFDHGIYAYGNRITARNNIVRFNSGWGVHLYPKIDHSVIENNLIHGNWRYGILVCSTPEVGSNMIVNNTVLNNGEGIGIENGFNDKVYNNIVINNRGQDMQDAIGGYGKGNLNKVEIGNNLCVPECKSGRDNITGDPKFIDVRKQVFYIAQNSSARGKGDPKYAPAYDFFGRPRDVNAPVDIGCFQFDPVMATSAYREHWYYQWPFKFSGQGKEMPDLWKPPGVEKLTNK